MEPTAFNANTPHSKVHIWIVMLLAWLIVLAMATIGILVVDDDKTDPEELAAACQNAITNGVSAQLDDISDACLAALDDGKAEKDADETEKVSASATTVGFEYPADWTAVMRDTTHNALQSFMTHLDPGFIFFCDGCDGPMVPITIRAEVKDSALLEQYGSYKAYYQALYAEETYSGMTSSEQALANGTMYTYAGRANGLGGPSDVESIHFEGATWVVSVYFDETDDGAEYDDAWKIVKESLDFSLIE